jgi:hypothetical protein
MKNSKLTFVLGMLVLALGLQACGTKDTAPQPAKAANTTAVEQKATITPAAIETPSPVKQEPPKQEEKPKIETKVFVYAKSVEVTDARNITNHINLVINMSEELTPGLASNHVLNQTYDFLQQEDIKGANTVTIGVMQGKFRVFQFTVDLQKFKTDDKIAMSHLVLKASKIDKMTDEVKQYGKTMQLW